MKNSKHIHLRSFFFWLKFHFIHKVIKNTLNYKILTLNSRCNTLSVEKLNMRNIAIPNSKVLYFILYSSVSVPVKKKIHFFFYKKMKYCVFLGYADEVYYFSYQEILYKLQHCYKYIFTILHFPSKLEKKS